ncbi:hypothetical protein KC19_1G049200 [Ceratodon purpureus]|uniref:Secreted protein n=1 Tax=Ceratodon purpureus TaxID=3225 RepID=A0A8T0J1J8_CERPU|nr:hypothetical protein KC19_1G049200 [Ceratodon purpureus]
MNVWRGVLMLLFKTQVLEFAPWLAFRMCSFHDHDQRFMTLLVVVSLLQCRDHVCSGMAMMRSSFV